MSPGAGSAMTMMYVNNYPRDQRTEKDVVECQLDRSESHERELRRPSNRVGTCCPPRAVLVYCGRETAWRGRTRLGSSVVEQGTHKPLVVGSSPTRARTTGVRPLQRRRPASF